MFGLSDAFSTGVLDMSVGSCFLSCLCFSMSLTDPHLTLCCRTTSRRKCVMQHHTWLSSAAMKTLSRLSCKATSSQCLALQFQRTSLSLRQLTVAMTLSWCFGMLRLELPFGVSPSRTTMEFRLCSSPQIAVSLLP